MLVVSAKRSRTARQVLVLIDLVPNDLVLNDLALNGPLSGITLCNDIT